MSSEREELKERMKSWGLESKPLTLDTPFAELGIFNKEFPEAKTLREVIEAIQEEDESTVSLDSQLGQDVAQYVARHFPGSQVTKIESSYHEGVFIGDYSIDLDVSLEHPNVQKVVLTFNQQDVPLRPMSWEELISLPGIRLFLHSISMRNIGFSEGSIVTYSVSWMYSEQLEQWCSKHPGGMLYGHVETPDMFIITTELLIHSDEEVKQAAKLLAVQAKAKIKQERPFLPDYKEDL